MTWKATDEPSPNSMLSGSQWLVFMNEVLQVFGTVLTAFEYSINAFEIELSPVHL